MDWQPIDTFKGRRRGQFAAFYFPEANTGRLVLGHLVSTGGPVYGKRRATHWLPLPKAPDA